MLVAQGGAQIDPNHPNSCCVAQYAAAVDCSVLGQGIMAVDADYELPCGMEVDIVGGLCGFVQVSACSDASGRVGCISANCP